MSALPLILITLTALPDGWREAKPVKNACSSPFEVSADFDGDGRIDTARLLSRNNGKRIGVFVWLEPNTPLLLESWEVPDGGHGINIGLQQAGTVETWCGRAGDCLPGDTEWVKLKQPTLGVGFCDRGFGLFVWREKKRNFRWVLMSD